MLLERKKIIVTLGPSTNTLDKLKLIQKKGIDFVRINMSHSTIKDLKFFINLSKKVGIPFIIDTEGSQVRTGSLEKKIICFQENDIVRLYQKPILGNKKQISLSPGAIISQLEEGDILYIDFDTLVMRITKVSTINKGYIEAQIVSSGNLGSNKGVAIDPRLNKNFQVPILTKKDIQAIKLGLKEGIEYVAASFMRSGQTVRMVKKTCNNKMKVISKIECQDALDNLNEIIHESDFLLIDRGDLSKEIPLEKIPFVQKIILNRASKKNKGVFVATNLLESMISNRKPTRAEVHDVINTIVDGAYGLTLAAETAIGENPISCINMLNKIIEHSSLVIKSDKISNKEKFFVKYLEKEKYLIDHNSSYQNIRPHGGALVNRVLSDSKNLTSYKKLKKIKLNQFQQLDLEQIAFGVYSPLEGFMTELELKSVINKMRLPNGTLWPLPILLDISDDLAKSLDKGDEIALLNETSEVVGIMKLDDIYKFDKKLLIKKLFNNDDPNHPGIRLIKSLKNFFIGGKILLIKNINRDYNKYFLTPAQTRRLIDEKNWSRVVGFHTRNAIHKAHEFIQIDSLRRASCDGLFIHPAVGIKKQGDYNSEIIIKSYELMQKHYYPSNKIIFGVFSTYSRYLGEREAIFTALCRKNYGCTHFIVGRDHTGVGNDEKNILKILPKLKDLGIKIMYYNKVSFSKKKQVYIEEKEHKDIKNNDLLSISGTDAREMFKNKKLPPSWYMRTRISKMIMSSINKNKNVFYGE